jgi:hypothetical protein
MTDGKLSFRGTVGTVQRILDTVFSLGFIKLVWDASGYLWRKVYRERVTADLDIAYRPPKLGSALEKCVFLIVRNGTDQPVTADMFIWESHFWHRYIRARKMHKIVLDKSIVTVPPKSAMRQGLSYVPGNIFYEGTNYFGLRLTAGKIVWVPTRHWRRAFREFQRDFPDWREHRRIAVPLTFKDYGR